VKLSNKVHDNQMENEGSKDEVPEGAFNGDGVEVARVLGVGLQTEAHSKNKRSNSGDEAGEERIEGEIANQCTVNKLCDASEEDVQQIGVDHLQFSRNTLHVVSVKNTNNSQQVGTGSWSCSSGRFLISL